MSDEEREVSGQLVKLRDWDLNDVTVSELATVLRQWLPCRVDDRALNDVGFASDDVIGTFRADQVSILDMLHHFLGFRDMSWTVDDGYLVLTTPEEAEEKLRLMVLPVVDLIETPGEGEEGYDYDSLISLITATVAPDAWDEGGKPISDFAGTLVIRQSWRHARHIELLLETLRRVKRKEITTDNALVPWYGFYFDADCQVPFTQPITIHAKAVSLITFVETLDQETKLPVRLDRTVLEDDRWQKRGAVDVSFQDEPLCSALRRALRLYGLTVTYDHPFLMITTVETAERETTTRIYPVNDLVDSCEVGLPVIDTRSLDALIEVITAEIAPRSWDAVGGDGSIEPFYSPPSLVVNQSLENHETLAEFLATLRRARESAPSAPKDSGLPHVAVYWLADGVPVGKTSQLLRQLIPEATDHRGEQGPTYLASFGQGVIVCQPRMVHRRVRQLLWSLGLARVSDLPSGGMGGFKPTLNGQSDPEKAR